MQFCRSFYLVTITIGSFAQTPFCQTATPTLSTAEIARRAIPATITVITLGSNGDTLAQGSGFLVKSDGSFVTNWHVMRGASRATVILATGEQFDRVTFLVGDSLTDIAILKFPGYGLPTISVSSTTPDVGSRVVVIGSPLGLKQTVTEGIVSASRLFKGKEFVQVSAAISPGSSGGPILDTRGRVFAIAAASIRIGQDLNFGVPVRYCVGLMSTKMTEAPLDSVFSNSSGSGSQNSFSLGKDSPDAWSPVANPRSNIEGTYFTHSVYLVLDSTETDTGFFEEQGYLILGRNEGLIRYWPSGTDTSSDSGFVMHIYQMNLGVDGRLALGIGQTNYDGYQAESGLVLTGNHISNQTKVTEEMRASKFRQKLSEPNGLYAIEARTSYHRGDGSIGSTTDWSGEAAVIIIRDSIHITISLENSAGGTTGGWFNGGKTRNNEFDLWVDDKKERIRGHIQMGMIVAEWFDMRDKGSYFEGTLTGKRR